MSFAERPPDPCADVSRVQRERPRTTAPPRAGRRVGTMPFRARWRRPRWIRRCAAGVLAASVAGCSPPSDNDIDDMNRSASYFRAPRDIELERAIRADDAPGIVVALAQGASANARGDGGTTPLLIAVDRQRPRAVDALLRAGADPEATAQDRRGPMYLAVQNYRSSPVGAQIAAALMRAGASPDARAPDGEPVILRFVDDRSCEGLRLMKSFGADLDIRDRAGDPLIVVAAAGRDFDVVWCLLQLGAAWDYERGKSRRPLSRALADDFPPPGSPMHAYKVKVWNFLHERGVTLAPLAEAPR